MRKNIEISDEKISEFLEQFYGYFESGYAFEEFLKVYLEKIGLDEVVVTQRSSDGGIDLEAVRYGVGGFAGADAVDYFVQAKRNRPGTTIPIEKVRALRGVMPSDSKGIFITTANYSKKTLPKVLLANGLISIRKNAFITIISHFSSRLVQGLIFGVTNKKEIVGTAYRQDGNLQNLKKEIVGGTNERSTFMEIYEVNMDGHCIVAFQIPPATRGIPRTWNGAAYAR